MERFGSIPVAAHSVFSCFLWEQVLLALALLKSVRSLLLGQGTHNLGESVTDFTTKIQHFSFKPC